MLRDAALSLVVIVSVGCAGSGAERSFDMRRQIVSELVERGNWDEAFARTRELLAENPDDPEMLTYRGIIYREQRLFRESEADLREAIEQDPDLAFAHAALGILLDLQKQSDEAEKHHKKAVALEPNNQSYLNNLGFSLYAHGKHRKSIQIYEQALRIDPTHVWLRNNLGFAYARIGDLTRAAEQFALAGSPAEAKNNLGFAYEQRGNLAQAYDLYVQALRLDPTLHRARENLVRVSEQLERELPAELLEILSHANAGEKS